MRRERSTSFQGRQICKGPEVRECWVFKGAGLSRVEIRSWQGGLSPQVNSVAMLRCMDIPKGGREALKECHSQVENWHPPPVQGEEVCEPGQS